MLILAGATVHCKVVEAAKAMGVYTIVTDYLESSPEKDMDYKALEEKIFGQESSCFSFFEKNRNCLFTV